MDDDSVGEGRGRPAEHSDDEVIRAVRAAIEETDCPGVVKEQVSPYLHKWGDDRTGGKLAELAVEKNRLGRLSERGYTYWVPNEEFASGDVNPDDIRKKVPPEEIDIDHLNQEERERLQEKLKEEQSRFASVYEAGVDLVHTGYVLFAFMLGSLWMNQEAIPLPLTVPDLIVGIFALFGAAFVLFGGLGILVGKVAEIVYDSRNLRPLYSR
jgi:hypothetical protein